MDTSITLADMLRKRRAELGKTQEEMAEALDMTQEWVAAVENGRIQQPRPTTLRRLADVLDVPLEDIVIAARLARSLSGAQRVAQSIAEEAAEHDWDDPTMRVVMDRASKMTPEQRRKLAELMDSLGIGNDHR